MHFRVMMFVSSGQGPTFMADRDSHCSQLPSNRVRSSEYHDDSPKRCLISSLQVVRVQISFMQRSKLYVPRSVKRLSSGSDSKKIAWGLQARQISDTTVYLIELSS
jgi:hypothetical protein